MIYKYRSGEEIKNGDRVLFHRQPAEVEFVAGEPGDSQTSSYLQKYGGGVMISDPAVSGHTFIQASQIGEYEDLEFVSRSDVRSQDSK
jgi:hypothetical protein